MQKRKLWLEALNLRERISKAMWDGRREPRMYRLFDRANDRTQRRFRVYCAEVGYRIPEQA